MGGAGQSPLSSVAVGTSGGWNGGGNGGYLSSGSNAGGGGGASDVRTGGTAGSWTVNVCDWQENIVNILSTLCMLSTCLLMDSIESDTSRRRWGWRQWMQSRWWWRRADSRKRRESKLCRLFRFYRSRGYIVD